MATETSNLYADSFVRNIGVISDEEQDKLRSARVTVVGAGGVGGIALIQLARMGVGTIHVIDRDSFEASNINRQMLSDTTVIGEPKALVAQRILTAINPTINVRVTQEFVTDDNAEELFADSDIVIDATDNLVSRVIVHRAAAQVGIPSVWIAVTPPFRGGVMTLTPDSPPFEQVMRHPSLGKELTEDVRNEVNAIKDARASYSVRQGALPSWEEAYQNGEAAWAVLAPVANIVGVLASFEVFKVIVDRDDLQPTIGPRLVKIDLAQEQMVKAVEPVDGSWDNTTL